MRVEHFADALFLIVDDISLFNGVISKKWSES